MGVASYLNKKKSSGPIVTPGDPEFLARFTDSQAQTPSAYAESGRNDAMSTATKALDEYGDQVSGKERETLLEVSKRGAVDEAGFFSKIMEFIDKPRELIMMGLADITDLDRKAEITGGDYWSSIMGRDDTLRDKLGEELVGDSGFSFSGSNLLDVAGMEPGLLRGTLGFMGDVALDPTTYIGSGFFAAGKKAAVAGIGLGTKTAYKEGFESLLKGTLKEATPAAQRFGDDIAKNIDEVAGELEENFLSKLAKEYGEDIPSEVVDATRAEARRLATMRHADDINKVMPAEGKISQAGFGKADRKLVDDIIGTTETPLRTHVDTTKSLVSSRQGKELERLYDDVIKHPATPTHSTLGLKAALPFSRKALDLGMRSNAPVRNAVTPFLEKMFKTMPEGFTSKLTAVWQRRGWEIPGLEGTKLGKGWALEAAEQGKKDLVKALVGNKANVGTVSVALKALRGVAEEVGTSAEDVDKLLARALSTPNPQGLDQLIDDPVMLQVFGDTVDQVRAVTETLSSAWQEFDPEFKEMAGYLTVIKTKEFSNMLSTLRAGEVNLRAADSASPSVKRGLALLNAYVTAANAAGAVGGAVDPGAARFAKTRKAGKAAFSPYDLDSQVHLLDKEQLGQTFDMGVDVGFMPHEDMNKAITDALQWIGETNPKLDLRKFNKQMKDGEWQAFSTDISEVLDAYIGTMTDAITFNAYVRSAKEVGLIRRQEFAEDVSQTIQNLVFAVDGTPEVRKIITTIHDSARGKAEALKSLQEVPSTTTVRIGTFDVEVDASAVGTPELNAKIESVSKRVARAGEHSREVVEAQEKHTRELVAQGIPEDMARKMATATTDRDLVAARVTIETDAHVRATMLEQAAVDALSNARTPEELLAAEATIEAARNQANTIRQRAKRQSKKIQTDWEKKFKFTETVTSSESTHLFDFDKERMIGIDGLIGKKVDMAVRETMEAIEGTVSEGYATRYRDMMSQLTDGRLDAEDRHQLLKQFDAKTAQESDRLVTKVAAEEAIDRVTVANLDWADIEGINPQGLYELVKRTMGKGNRSVSPKVTEWRYSATNRAPKRNDQVMTGLDIPELAGDQIKDAAARDAIIEWAKENQVTVADLFRSTDATFDEIFSDSVVAQVLASAERRIPVGKAGKLPSAEDAAKTVESFLGAKQYAIRMRTQSQSKFAALAKHYDPQSVESRVRSALRQGKIDELVPFEGTLREMLEDIGLESDGIRIHLDPKTKQHTISYSQVTQRETHRVVTLDSVKAEINELFPLVKDLPTQDRIGFLKDLADQAPEALDGASADLRYFLAEINKMGGAPPELALLGKIDALNAKAQGLQDLANLGKTQLDAQFPDAAKAWPKVRRDLRRALEGGSVATMRKTWAAAEGAIRGMDDELANQTQYLIDYVGAIRAGDIPKSMIDRNMRLSQSMWDGADQPIADLQAFAARTGELKRDAELSMLTEQISDIEEFREAFARLIVNRSGSAGEGGSQLRKVMDENNPGRLELTLDGAAGEEFASQYAEVATLANRIGRDISGNVMGLDLEQVARVFPELPANASDRQVRNWLEAKLRPLEELPKVSDKAPISEGFLPPEAVGLIGGHELNNQTMDTFMAVMLENMAGSMRALNTPAGLGAFSENTNALVRYWKTAATIGRPTFVLRNLIGGSYNSWMMGAGVREYKMVGNGAVLLRRAHLQTGDWTEAVKVLKGRDQAMWKGLIDSEILQGGFNTELRHVIEDTSPTMASRLNPLDTQNFEPFRQNAKFMQSSEDFMRASVFFRWFDPDNPASVDFAKTMADAAHFDYQNLSTLELQAKRFVPFFVWSRRNIPLQLQALIERPGFATKYKHLMVNIEESSEDSVADDFAESEFLSGFAAKTGFTFGGETPFWGRIILDPDVPVKDLDEAFQHLGDGEIVKFLTSMLNPGLTMPFDMQASAEFGDVNAPAGLHSVLKGLHAIGLWDNTSQNGDPQVSYNTRKGLETAVPYLNEFSTLLGAFGQNDPGRQARAGIDNSDGVDPMERIRATLLTLGKAGGISLQTPDDQKSASFNATEAIRGILGESELRGDIDRDR